MGIECDIYIFVYRSVFEMRVFFDERYSNDIALSLMSIYECRKVKIGRGGAGDLDARGNWCIYITFSFAPYVSLFSLDKKLKQKLFIPHVFFYKEVFINCYFLEITNTHVLCTTIIEQHRRR